MKTKKFVIFLLCFYYHSDGSKMLNVNLNCFENVEVHFIEISNRVELLEIPF